MRFEPKSEEQLQLMSLMPEGSYDFQVISAKDRVSKSGNEMIEVQLKVWDIQGKEHIVYDYLLEAMAYKLRHFAEGCGLLDKYNIGTIEATDCEGKFGKAEIIIQHGQVKPEGGKYLDKNSVKDYVRHTGLIMDRANKPAEKPSLKEQGFDDDIPF